jgi:hypothetical protein
MEAYTNGYIRGKSMKDSLLLFIAWVVVMALIFTVAWTTAWAKFAGDIAIACEKSSGFSVNNKTYKCELIK